MTTTEITYDYGDYAVYLDDALIAYEPTIRAARLTLEAQLEALHSMALGGGPCNLLMDAPERAALVEDIRQAVEGVVSDPAAPLLAQCAHAIRAVLGNVPANGGIIDELRAVEAALENHGW